MARNLGVGMSSAVPPTYSLSLLSSTLFKLHALFKNYSCQNTFTVSQYHSIQTLLPGTLDWCHLSLGHFPEEAPRVDVI